MLAHIGYRWGILIGVLTVFAAVGCGRGSSPPDTLRLAMLPILDTLPLYVAEAEGYFADAGVPVTFIPVASAAERDQLLQAGRVDGVITDLVALALYNQAEVQVVAVRTAMVPAATMPQFRILAAGQWLDQNAPGGVTSTIGGEVLRGIPIGISEGTVIAYVTDRLLQAEGLRLDDIRTLAVPKISDRMALLRSGELRAATLPEPLASLAIQEGAVVIVDDTQYPEYSTSVFAVRKAVLDARPETVRGFLAAIERASVGINANPTRWQSLLVERKLVPTALAGDYILPNYPTLDQDAPLVPTAAQFIDVLHWLEAAGRLDRVELSYRDVVSGSFLPQ
jgi:NitT/TauT family transport system substrate-binding protein